MTDTPKVSWEGVGKVEKIVSITVGGDVFVRADWDAYDTGYEACKTDAFRAIEVHAHNSPCCDGYEMNPRHALDLLVALPPQEDDPDPEFTEMGTPRFNHGVKLTNGELTVSLHSPGDMCHCGHDRRSHHSGSHIPECFLCVCSQFSGMKEKT